MTLADIDAGIAAAQQRLYRRHRDAELDYEREIAPLVMLRAKLIVSSSELATNEYLTQIQVARLPIHTGRTVNAVRCKIKRAISRDPIDTGQLNRPKYPIHWLRRNDLA